MMNYIVVFAGGGIGSVARYMLATWIGQRWGRSFPFGTFIVNVSGSFLIGLLMTLMAERFLENPEWRLLIVVGGLGGYTTFSTFEYETGKLMADGELIYAALNIILSVIAGFAALKLGEVIARSI
ncbi:putative fluoride ion transporter CrcB [Candidatus Sulfobium mesophilum]|uniref:Fluoride-specific ion channel FluC n=1 Tax=Candidatus Sulfobium mesophilum TaxID=2016548 RepID=A0A2U3QI44_9BACT|nr:putative fluoride ion transporter CrcB [Candidatus Sulfobium mesophilum]